MGNYSDGRLKRAAATVKEGECEGARYAAIWHLERLNNELSKRNLKIIKTKLKDGSMKFDAVKLA